MLAPRHVAIFRALQIGDLLVAIPALRALRRAWPDARLTLIGLPWSKVLLPRLAHLIDEVVAFPGFPGLPEQPFDPGQMVPFFAGMQGRRFDLALQMHGGGRYSNPIVRLLGAGLTAGFTAAHEPDLLDITAPWKDERHEVLRWLDLANLLGAPAAGTQIELPVLPDDRRELGEVFHTDGPYAVVHPSARPLSRRWPTERFAEVANRLTREGLRIVLVGSADERALIGPVAARLAGPVSDLTGRTSIGGLAALIQGAAVFVGNDSGPAHIARAVGTPAVTVYGSARLENWGPLDGARHRSLYRPLPCRPHGCAACAWDYHCLRSIGADEVAAAALEILRLPRAVPDLPLPASAPSPEIAAA